MPITPQSLAYTHLCLWRYARIMGIPPVHFAGATAGTIFPGGGSCNALWYKYAWQGNDRVSYEDLINAIRDAEAEIARMMGYWPAPTWLTNEPNRLYPRFYQTLVTYGPYGNVHSRESSVRTLWGKVINPGRRTATFISNVRVAYTDEDSDGFFETATVTFSTTVTDLRELKIYFPNHSGDMEWEIRPARSKALSSGTATIVFWSYQLIDPSLYEWFPTAYDHDPIDISVTTNFVATVDAYRIFNDTTQVAAQFTWEPDVSCDADTLALTTQNGTFLVREPENGIIIPYPATYGTDWQREEFTICAEPDNANLWYYAGDQSQEYLAGRDYDPLSDWWARIIAHLATTRLERPFCSCGNLLALQQDLRKDLALAEDNVSFATSEEVLSCPFGTRKGEVMAWKRIVKFSSPQVMGMAV